MANGLQALRCRFWLTGGAERFASWVVAVVAEGLRRFFVTADEARLAFSLVQFAVITKRAASQL
ncbi:hypothetical protein BSR09_18750 [Stutzerimonas degradans]|jgi:hypothetical protein|nr:hypothetical protein BSR09_18750 [Stutzerimonas degradans]